MDEKQVYAENEKLFASGIASGITKSPYRFTSNELNSLEHDLHTYSKKFGEPAILISWGQPFFALDPDRLYHPTSKIERLQELYKKFDLKGICPKAKASFDLKWVSEQRERLKRTPIQSPEHIDLESHIESLQDVRF